MNTFNLKYLKEQDQDDWVDLIDENIRHKPPSKWSQEEKVFYPIMCWHSYMSAGFCEYYGFCGGVDSMNEIEESLKTIGADEYLKVIQQANSINKKNQDIIIDMPEEDCENDKLIEELTEPYYDKLRNLDNKFYELQEQIPLKDILLKYVKKNIEKFV